MRRLGVKGFTLLGLEWRRLIAVGVLMFVDWTAVFVCLALSWSLRNGPLRSMSPILGPLYPFRIYLSHLYFLLPWVVAFIEAGLYTRRLLFWDEVRRVVRACTFAALFAIFLSFAVRPTEELSRLVIFAMWFGTLLAVPLARYNIKRMLAALGLWTKRVLILGAGEPGIQVYQRIRANPVLGYQPIAFVDDDPVKIGHFEGGLPVRGGLTSIPDLLHELAAKDIVIALPRLPREQLLRIISQCEGQVETIRIVPDMFDLASVGVETEDLDGLLLLSMRCNLAKPWNIALKRSFDCVVAAATGVVIAPLLILTAAAIWFDSAGPVLFVQQRLGRSWRHFRCLKFRTMYVDNEQRLQQYLTANPDAREEWNYFAKLKSLDPRVTRVGRLLRRLSLDELPQLLNVLNGGMSLVGPRPYLPSEAGRMGDFAETILKAPPGLTGLWQVSGRNELTFDQRLRLDEYYVRNWSLWMDIIVLVKTIGALIRRDGAF